jgi:hypothetical protein
MSWGSCSAALRPQRLNCDRTEQIIKTSEPQNLASGASATQRLVGSAAYQASASRLQASFKIRNGIDGCIYKDE